MNIREHVNSTPWKIDCVVYLNSSWCKCPNLKEKNGSFGWSSNQRPSNDENCVVIEQVTMDIILKMWKHCIL